jgi:DNA polymerase V
VYLVKIDGDSMQGAGIYHGDLVIVDRSLYAEHGDIVIAALNTEPLCKRLHMRENEVILMSENPKYPARHVMEGDELVIWGVVKYSVRDHDKT